jgi:hypothetical protein
MSGHTATPWSYSREQILTTNGRRLLVNGVSMPTGSHPLDAEASANAEFIVRAVNSHDALASTLKALRDAAMNTPALDDSKDWTALIMEADKALVQANAPRTEGGAK